MGVKFFHADEQANGLTDMTKLTVDLCNFANSSKNLGNILMHSISRAKPYERGKGKVLPVHVIKLYCTCRYPTDRIIRNFGNRWGWPVPRPGRFTPRQTTRGTH